MECSLACRFQRTILLPRPGCGRNFVDILRSCGQHFWLTIAWLSFITSHKASIQCTYTRWLRDVKLRHAGSEITITVRFICAHVDPKDLLVFWSENQSLELTSRLYNLEATSAYHKVNKTCFSSVGKKSKQITLHSWHFDEGNHFDFIWAGFPFRTSKCVPCQNYLGNWDQHWIIEIFIRASGVEEWSVRNVFNLKLLLHWYVEKRKQCLLIFVHIHIHPVNKCH